MRCVLCAGAHMQDRKNFREGGDGQPEKDAPVWRSAAGCAIHPTAGVGGADGRRSARVSSVHASPRSEHDGDLLRGGFQTVQGGVASGTEGGVAGRASKRLDPFNSTMLAIPDESMDLSICNGEVQALLVGTGVPLGVDSLGCSPAVFDLAQGRDIRMR
jgi:hypothetical protein